MKTTYAFQIGYLGDGFAGYARQPGLSTVEGTLVEELRTRHVLGREDRVLVASRTDRGVHALGNVVAFATALPGPAAARALGTLDPRILCFGWAEVPGGFQPRHARGRWYRYLEPAEGHRLATWEKGCRLFEGFHDFASFSRRDDPPRPSRGEVAQCRVTREGDFLVVSVRAPLFRWNQVRKMVAALELLDQGRLTEGRISRALAGEVRLDLPLADPSRLVLMEVAYDFPFHPTGGGRPAQRRFWEEALRGARAKATLLGWFQSRVAAVVGSEE